MKNIDYRSFLSKHDMRFTMLPRAWYEAPFIGNGSTGVVGFFDGDGNLFLNIGDTDIYDNRGFDGEEKNMLFQTPRLSLGGFLLKTKGGFQNCDLTLSLYDAKFFGDLESEQGKIFVDCFTVEGQKAFFFTWQDKGETEISFVPYPAQSPRQYKMLLENDKRMSLHYEEPKEGFDVREGKTVTHIQPKFNGGEYRIYYTVKKDGEQNTLICFIENVEADENKKRNPAVLDSLYEKKNELYEEHLNFWHTFYEKSFFSLDDTKLEGFYWIQLYKCAAATRSGCRVYDTAGPWLCRYTAWPAGWWNLNVELHYSLLYPSNHCEIAESLIETLEKGKGILQNNVPEKIRNGRFVAIGRNTTSSLSTPCDVPGESTIPNNLEVGNLLWALHNCYVHLESLCDEERIRSFLFPMLKNAAECVCEYLYEGEDGKYHLPPTASPEYPGLGIDCAYNLSLLKWGLLTLLKLNEKYGMKDGNDVIWQYTLEKSAPLPIDEEEGVKIAADIPYAQSHRHYSHLLAFYPLHFLDERNEKEKEIVEKSVAFWQSKPKGLQGYSQSGAASMYAYLGNGEKAYEHLCNLFKGFIQKNTMYHEDFSPVLETPPAAARSMLDMVMISTNGEIRVFTGTPSVWQNVSYCDLLAENGCLVTAKRVNGKTAFVKITSNKGCNFKLYGDFEGLAISGNAEKQNGYYDITLKDEESIVLSSAEETGEILEIKWKKAEEHSFGLQ